MTLTGITRGWSVVGEGRLFKDATATIYLEENTLFFGHVCFLLSVSCMIPY